jgi:hypothetical protein
MGGRTPKLPIIFVQTGDGMLSATLIYVTQKFRCTNILQLPAGEL